MPVAVVTGSNKGIGFGIVRGLCKKFKGDVYLTSRDEARGLAAVEALKKEGLNPKFHVLDICNDESIIKLRDYMKEKYGGIDILVNNVGVAPPNPPEKVTEEDYDMTMDLNVKATFFTSQAVGRHMIERGGGRIINMSSQAGFIALEDEAIYCSSKAAVNHMTRNLASEWARYNITVNAVAPTFIETPGTEPWLKDKEFRQSVIDRIPLGRVGQPHEVSGPVVFLASDADSLIAGSVLLIDGGWTAR